MRSGLAKHDDQSHGCYTVLMPLLSIRISEVVLQSLSHV